MFARIKEIIARELLSTISTQDVRGTEYPLMPAPHTWLSTSFAPEAHMLPWPTSPHPRIRSVTEARQFSSAAPRVHPPPIPTVTRPPETRSFHAVVCFANALVLSTLTPKCSFQYDRRIVSAPCCKPFRVRPGFKILEASGLCLASPVRHPLEPPHCTCYTHLTYVRFQSPDLRRGCPSCLDILPPFFLPP